jgi:hypothetical protein
MLKDLPKDIYARTVSIIITGVRGMRLMHMLLGVIVTFGLQMGILILLWFVVIHPPQGGTGQSETEGLWTQAGHLQGQLCRLQTALQESGINVTQAMHGSQAMHQCFGAWPSRPPLKTGPFEERLDVSEVGRDMWEQFKPCLVPFTSRNEGECARIFLNLDPNPTAFGCGLIYPDSNQECEFKVPEPEISTLLVNILAFLALAILVHGEIRNATTLCHVAAAAAGILPRFYTTPMSQALHQQWSTIHCLLRLVMLLAPIMQFSVALVVLLSGVLLSLTQEQQASSIQVIVNSVALAFILEIDNKVGEMFTSQQEQWADSQLRGKTGGLGGDVPVGDKSPSGYRACAGHVYFAFLGLLLFIEPVLLSPQAAAWVFLGMSCQKLELCASSIGQSSNW